jgi:hypothetical protein
MQHKRRRSADAALCPALHPTPLTINPKPLSSAITKGTAARQPSPSAAAQPATASARIIACILALTSRRGPEKSICPSEVQRVAPVLQRFFATFCAGRTRAVPWQLAPANAGRERRGVGIGCGAEAARHSGTSAPIAAPRPRHATTRTLGYALCCREGRRFRRALAALFACAWLAVSEAAATGRRAAGCGRGRRCRCSFAVNRLQQLMARCVRWHSDCALAVAALVRASSA